MDLAVEAQTGKQVVRWAFPGRSSLQLLMGPSPFFEQVSGYPSLPQEEAWLKAGWSLLCVSAPNRKSSKLPAVARVSGPRTGGSWETRKGGPAPCILALPMLSQHTCLEFVSFPVTTRKTSIDWLSRALNSGSGLGAAQQESPWERAGSCSSVPPHFLPVVSRAGRPEGAPGTVLTEAFPGCSAPETPPAALLPPGQLLLTAPARVVPEATSAGPM